MMVTRARRTRISDAELRERIREYLRREPDLSARAIASRIRAGNVSVSNDRARAITRLERATQQSNAANSLRRPFAASGLTYDRASFATDRQLAEAIYRTNPQRANVITASHVAIDYAARLTYTPYNYGKAGRQKTVLLTGRIIQPLAAYEKDLVEKRIEDQLVGRLEQLEFNDTDLEGRDIVVHSTRVTIRTLTLGGDRRR